MEKRFLIVGLGLLGGRYAMGLARAGFCVDGADTDPAAVAHDPDDAADEHGHHNFKDYPQYPARQIRWLRVEDELVQHG